MLAAYGVDVLDPAVSLRRVWVLLNQLPPAARRGGEQWSAEAELLALLVDHVAQLTWVTLRAHGAKNAARPKPVPRPPRPGRPVGEPGRDAASAEPTRAGQPVKSASWIDAAKQIAAIPGVVVSTDG